MKKVVVTGATSMIGIAIIEAALEQDVECIYAVVRDNSEKIKRLSNDNRIVQIACDIDAYDTLPEKIADKCDVFYHAAWGCTGAKRNENIMCQYNNIGYTLDAVKAAAKLGCKKFIGTGSQAEYGKLDVEKITPDLPVDPVQVYGICKYTAGKLAKQEAEQLGMLCIWVRIFSVYGKYDKPTTMISSSIRKMLAGERTSFTEGIQRWDYLYSKDAGEAFYLLGKYAEESKVYCLGSGIARPLSEFILEMRDAVNPMLKVGLGDIPYAKDTVMNLCADISILTADTGWMPRTDFATGIRETIAFLKKEKQM